MPTYDAEIRAFSERVIGQPQAANVFGELLASLKTADAPRPRGPRAVVFMAGPSGVGKTEMAKSLVALLSGDESGQKLLKVNGESFQSSHEVSKLIGSPPGYRDSHGSTDSGIPPIFSQENIDSHAIIYTDKAGNPRKTTVILIDEADKTHQDFHTALLGALDDGRLQLGNNQTTDMTDVVILYASNLGSSDAESRRAELILDGSTPDDIHQAMQDITAQAFLKRFPAEYQGRIGEPLVFRRLEPEHVRQIAEKNIATWQQFWADLGVHIELTVQDHVLDWLVAEGYSTTKGVRPLQDLLGTALFRPLVRINGESPLDGTKIVVGRDEGAVEFKFYDNGPIEASSSASAPRQVSHKPGARIEQPVMPHSKGPEVIKYQPLPDPIAHDLLKTLHNDGMAGFLSRRNALLQEGKIVPGAAEHDVRVLQEVDLQASEFILTDNIAAYRIMRTQAQEGGLVRHDMFGQLPQVLRAAETRVTQAFLNRGESDRAIHIAGFYQANGIGTAAFWNNVFAFLSRNASIL